MQRRARSLEEEYFQACLDQSRPYFGRILRATQGNPIRHVYMQALVEAECRGGDGRPLAILEIGSWAGGSAITWAEGIKRFNRGAGAVLCVDPWRPYLGESWRKEQACDLRPIYEDMEDALVNGGIFSLFLHNIRAAHCDQNIRVLKGKSAEAFPLLANERFDIIFVDGDHSYACALDDLRRSARLLRQGGILCGDDLELQISQLDPETVRAHGCQDFVRDPRTGLYYHPGISLAVGEFFGEVSAREGFWAMRRREEGWEGVPMAEIPLAASRLPAHLRESCDPLFIEEYRGHNIIRLHDTYFALAHSLGAVDISALDPETCAAFEAAHTCLRGQSPEDVKDLADQVLAGVPQRRLVAATPAASGVRTGDVKHGVERGREDMNSSPDGPVKRSAASLLAAGNCVGAASISLPDQWEWHAALGLMGKAGVALEMLERSPHPEARFYGAVAQWIAGNEGAAVRGLEKIPTPHAQNLLALIRKPVIHVLAQMPWFRGGPQNLLGGAANDAKFAIRNISFHPDDVPNVAYADINQLVDPRTPPDFYVCQMIEWHLIPPNLHDLTCPLLGQTSDYDAHIQAVYPWLQLFDEILVTDGIEWEEVSRLVRSPVSTFLKTFGVPDTLPPIARGPRETDVFLSGSIISTYQSDKIALLHQVLQASDLKLEAFNGFLPAKDYWAHLARSKASFTYGRRPGGTQTRGLESLSMGCAVVVQPESVLRLFAGEDEGVLTYDLEAGTLPTALRRIVRHWGEFEQRARRGAEVVRREFSLSRVASQYLRFLTFLAAKPRSPRRRCEGQRLDQRRSILRYGPIQGDTAVMQRIADANLARWTSATAETTDPNTPNLICRETLLDLLADQNPAAALRREQVARLVLTCFWSAIQRWPQSLVLRFNMVRAALHFGSPEEVTRALAMAEESADQSPSAWRIQPLEDVFPWDFCSTYFNYRDYLDRVTQACVHGTDPSPELIRLIRAALNHYVGCYSGDVERLRQATILDPGFPYYRLTYAKRLLERGSAEDMVEASALLMDLAENSLVFLEAHAVLDALGPRLVGDHQRRIKIAALARRVGESLHLQAYALPEPLRPARLVPVPAQAQGERAPREVPGGFVFLRDQEPLTAREFEIARRMCRDVAELVEGRSAYLAKAGLDPAVYSPAGNWQPENLEGYRRVVSGNPEILAHLRLFSQMFSGYRLIDMRPAAGTRVPADLPHDLDRSLEAIARRQDAHAARYAATIARAPRFLRISPPPKFGEIGWNVDGRIANHDAYVCLERLLLLYEAGLLDPADSRSLLRRSPVRILEIGGGYGGLAYFLKQVLPQARYTIVDLPESLLFSGVYLSVLFQNEANTLLTPDSPLEALDASAPGFTFVPNHLFPRLREAGCRYDLVMNTLSMSEMTEAQVREYCRHLQEMLAEGGVFFEQNHDNRSVNHLNACDIVADYFPGRQRLNGQLTHGTTQGAAHIWSLRAPVSADGTAAAVGGGSRVPSDLRDLRTAPGEVLVSQARRPDAIRELTAARDGRCPKEACTLSALVSVYRAERFLPGLLEDLERQTIARDMEIIIVDSGSPENERLIVEAFRLRCSSIVYLRTEARENSHAAVNRAIHTARGKYLTVANADDRHRPDAFEKMVAVLEARPDVALVYADSAITDQENATLASARVIGHLRLPEFDRRELFRGCCIGPQPMWRRALHDRHGYFDPEYQIAGDYEMWLRMGKTETFAHIPETLGLYLMSPTSNERVNRILRHQETERARRAHWPAEWGELPPWDADYNVMEPPPAPPPACSVAPAGTPAARGLEAGRLALDRREWAQACGAFIQVLEADQNCAGARSGLGTGLMALGDSEEGLAQLQEAVRLEPGPDHVCNLACGLIQAGREAEAELLLRGILETVPRHEAARAALDRLLASRPNERAPRPQQAEPADPRDLRALLTGAAGHLAAKRWSEAVAGFEAVLQVAPDLAEARAALGSAFLVLGRIPDAIRELAEAAKSLDTSEAWNNLGWACSVEGRAEETRAALIRAIERDPGNLEPQRNLAALFETLRLPREAAAAYDLILLTAPGDREAVAGKARCGAAAPANGSSTGRSSQDPQVDQAVLSHG